MLNIYIFHIVDVLCAPIVHRVLSQYFTSHKVVKCVNGTEKKVNTMNLLVYRVIENIRFCYIPFD